MVDERLDDEIDLDANPNLDVPVDDRSDDFSKTEQPSIWKMIQRFFYQTKSEREADNQQRLSRLDQAIETYPDVAVNYVLRGELLLSMKLREAAKNDFKQALLLAEEQLETDRWGLSSQAIRDRASRGLHRIG
ncbi:MAG: hypothetical protein AAF846_04205 [Chloroflexota bacterium]